MPFVLRLVQNKCNLMIRKISTSVLQALCIPGSVRLTLRIRYLIISEPAVTGYCLDIFEAINRRRKKYYVGGSVCRVCCHFGVCTTNRIHGRKITRLLNEELKEKLELQYQEPESQKTYRLRKEKVELPFGHIKHNLKVSGFLLRGLEGARAEMSLFSTCFNMARMISIIGVQGLLAKLAN